MHRLKLISVQWLSDCISASLNIDQLMHHSWTKIIFLLLNQPKWPSSSLHTPAHLGTCLTLKQRWVIFQSYGPPQTLALVISIWSPIHFLSRRLINLVWTNRPRSESQVHVMHKTCLSRFWYQNPIFEWNYSQYQLFHCSYFTISTPNLLTPVWLALRGRVSKRRNVSFTTTVQGGSDLILSAIPSTVGLLRTY